MAPDEIVDAWAAGYEAGRLAAYEQMCERAADLDAQHLPPPARSYAERVAERVALFEQCAAEFAEYVANPKNHWPGYDPLTNAESPHRSAGFQMIPAPTGILSNPTTKRNQKQEASVYEHAGYPNI